MSFCSQRREGASPSVDAYSLQWMNPPPPFAMDAPPSGCIPPLLSGWTADGQQAVGTHRTGMHTCYQPQRSQVGKVMFSQVCVILFIGGLLPELLPGGGVSGLGEVRRVCPEGMVRPPPPPSEMATAAVGKHPTGMHSC